MILRIDCYLMMLLYLGIIERTRGHLKEVLEEEKTRLVGQFKMEAQHMTSLRQIRTPGPVRTKTDAQFASGVRLGRSFDGWKAYKITFDLPPVLLSQRESSK